MVSLRGADHQNGTCVEERSFAGRNCTSHRKGYSVVDCGGTLFSTSRSAYMFPETAVFPPIVRAPSHAVGGLP
ncbi:hypothetical protein IG631_02050 [Alternaria alternata]|nr:hypothetical protein IG631_02050 [Alternaria alternata]